jgi:hypothetical protein
MKLVPKYHVFLRADLSPSDRALFESCCTVSPATDGSERLVARCIDIDISHHVFAELQAIREGDEVAVNVLIPHHLIILIQGDEIDRPIGFTTT